MEKMFLLVFLCFLNLSSKEDPITVQTSDSDYYPIVQELVKLYENDTEFANTIDMALANASKDKISYPQLGSYYANFSWQGKRADDLFKVFNDWLKYIPEPATSFAFYEMIYKLCENNNNAIKLVSSNPGLQWTKGFVKARGRFMDSKESITSKNMKLWKKNLGNQWYDYIIPRGGFRSFNGFFTRRLRTPRPVTLGGDIIVSPADALINMINYNIGLETKLHTKFDEFLNVEELLNGSKYATKFDGGTAVSCILLPDVYHHYHAPVAGEIVESNNSVSGLYLGMDGDFNDILNSGNIGGWKTNFGVFGRYHRGYFIIKTKDFGHVAMIPVGLDDISSVQFEEKFNHISKGDKPVFVEKGERVGNFAYGGSLVILIFEKNIMPGIKINQGSKLGIMKKKKIQ